MIILQNVLQINAHNIKCRNAIRHIWQLFTMVQIPPAVFLHSAHTTYKSTFTFSLLHTKYRWFIFGL